jgi:hypothetical protein
METKIELRATKEIDLKPVRSDNSEEQMTWTYWTGNDDFECPDITIILERPDKLSLRIRWVSKGVKTISHPYYIISFWDKNGVKLIDWNTGIFPLNCNTDDFLRKEMIFPEIFKKAFRASFILNAYTIRRC